MSAEVEALNRIADALFQQAKALRSNTKVFERQATCSEKMLEMQKANLAVTKLLEAKLALQTGNSDGSA